MSGGAPSSSSAWVQRARPITSRGRTIPVTADRMPSQASVRPVPHSIRVMRVPPAPHRIAYRQAAPLSTQAHAMSPSQRTFSAPLKPPTARPQAVTVEQRLLRSIPPTALELGKCFRHSTSASARPISIHAPRTRLRLQLAVTCSQKAKLGRAACTCPSARRSPKQRSTKSTPGPSAARRTTK